MGLVARAVEAAGIPTLSLSSAWDITYSVRPPRAVFVNFPLNHQIGKPNDPKLQRRILLDALRAFELFWQPGMMLTLPYVWDANDTSWEERDYGPEAQLYGVGRAVQAGFVEQKLKRA